MLRKFFNTLGNMVMKPLLVSPLHFLVSNHLLLLRFKGRKSGKLYATPVEYRQQGDELMIFTQQERKWWRNLIGGAAVTVILKGQAVAAVAEPFTAEQIPLGDLLRQMYPYLSNDRRAALEPHSVYIKVRFAKTGQN